MVEQFFSDAKLAFLNREFKTEEEVRLARLELALGGATNPRVIVDIVEAHSCGRSFGDLEGECKPDIDFKYYMPPRPQGTRALATSVAALNPKIALD